MEDFLYHHGILGQKWGVRRYQNKDGSLTNDGRKRYSYKNTDIFEKMKKNVKTKLSNDPNSYIKEPINLSTIMNRAKISETDAKKCAELANDIFDSSAKDIIESIKLSNSSMYGLEHRLKQPTSIAGKIAVDSKEKNISFNEASAKINDSIRYTAILDDTNFVNNYNNIQKELSSKGYVLIKSKNYFDLYAKGEAMHKSIQNVYSNKNGKTFELQYQTIDSQAAKELKIPIYEERRKIGISEKRALELEKKMRDLAEKVNDPIDVRYIGQELYHHGILGQKWGIRRYQNPDGSLTEAGKRHLDKKDSKWARKNYDKIYKKTYKESRKELQEYVNREMTPVYNANGKLSSSFINAYNAKMAEVMNRNVSDISAPSGRIVQFVAKRGEVGVHMALADRGYDMSQFKRGVWSSGRVAYKKKTVERV